MLQVIVHSLPRDITNPPKTKIVSKAHDPNVFATMTFLPNAAIRRNNPEAIWLAHISRRICLKNLPLKGLRDYKCVCADC